MKVKVNPAIVEKVVVEPETITLVLTRDEAEAILFTLGRVVNGPTDSLAGGLNLYSPMYDAIFGDMYNRPKAPVAAYEKKVDHWLKRFRF